MRESSSLQNIIKKIDNLPPLPWMITKILKTIESKKTGASELAGVISLEPVLVAKVLRTVNSSFYGFDKKISSPSRAVVILGVHAMKNLALSLSFLKVFQERKNTKSLLKLEKLCKHSLEVAACCRLIAKISGYYMPEEAFTAGMLHDIGQLIFIQNMAHKFNQSLEKSLQENIHLFEAEREIIGIDHTEAGEWLAKKWNLPSPLVEAIRYHHDPPSSNYFKDVRTFKIVMITYLANTLCNNKSWQEEGFFDIKEEIWSGIGLAEDKREAILSELEKTVKESKILFDVI